MKSLPAIAPVSALLWLAPVVLAADPPQDPLWRKAVTIAAANSDWVPGLTITRSEVLFRGKPEGTHEFWQRSKPGPKGEVVTETVKVLEDGKDVTKEEKLETPAKPEKKADKGKGKKSAGDGKSGGGGNPFDPDVQDRVSLKPAHQPKVVEGRDCAGYQFELKNAGGPLFRGTAWLEKQTGVPLEVENMTMDPLPDKRLKSLVMTTRYDTTTNGTWLVKSNVTLTTVSVLLLKANARTTITFSEHWKKAAGTNAMGSSAAPPQ